MHWHAWQWVGDAKDMDKMGPRRPPFSAMSPRQQTDHWAVFTASKVPPEMTDDVLLRPADHIAADFKTAAEAIEWYADARRAMDEMRHARAPDWCSTESQITQLRTNPDRLKHAIVHAEYRGTGKMEHLTILPCPGKHPCPKSWAS